MVVVKILTYNCYKGGGNQIALNRHINSVDADVICLQEYTSKVGKSLKLKGYNFIEPKGKQGFFRNVMYSKYPPTNLEFVTIPNMKRQMPVLTIRKNNINITIACIHLSSGNDKKSNRETEMNFIVQKFKHYTNVILAGDFNMRSDETISYFDTCPLLPTYCGNNSLTNGWKFNHPFDRICYKGFRTINGPSIIGDKEKIPASDHYGLTCELETTSSNSRQCIIL